MNILETLTDDITNKLMVKLQMRNIVHEVVAEALGIPNGVVAAPPAPVAPDIPARSSFGRGGTHTRSAAPRKRGGGSLTAAGRKKLSEAAKKRWAMGRKLGKTTL